jgi:serine/threonine protein kinase
VRAAHQRGITHRDLKPANVMVGEGGRVRVLDFGWQMLKLQPARGMGQGATAGATLTDQYHIVGAAAYMSPEQAEGRPVDHRTDIFALEVLLYEMTSGARPFTGDTTVSVISSILKGPPPLVEAMPDVPDGRAAYFSRRVTAADVCLLTFQKPGQ